jgi:hypothetical protein
MWHTWERRRKYTKVLVGKPEEKRPLKRPRHRWEDGIRMQRCDMGDSEVLPVKRCLFPVHTTTKWRETTNKQ